MKADYSQAEFMILFLGMTAILPYPPFSSKLSTTDCGCACEIKRMEEYHVILHLSYNFLGAV
jgi:hypothetical protein